MINIEVFMGRYFNKLPSDIQVKIMLSIDHWKIPPNPKFSIYQSVKYKKEYTDEIRKNLRNYKYESHGEMPFGKLFIDEKPQWSKKTKEWIYNYVYGFCGNHEGYAREEDLEEYK